MIEWLFHPFAMLLYGMVANMLGILEDASSQQKEPVHPVEFFRRRPYRFALGIIAGLAGYGALADTGQLTAIAAFGVGYMGVDALSKIANAASNRFKKV